MRGRPLLYLMGPYSTRGYDRHRRRGWAQSQTHRTDKPGYFRPHLTQSISAVPPLACWLKSIYRASANEEQLAVAFNDVDFCLRARGTGFKRVHAMQSLSIRVSKQGSDLMPCNTARFAAKRHMRERWGAVLDDDPYYSPHLTREYEASLSDPNPGLRIKFFHVANRCSYRSGKTGSSALQLWLSENTKPGTGVYYPTHSHANG